jgi:KIF-binding protein
MFLILFIRFIVACIRIQNTMGILWAQRTEDQSSLKSLLVAQSLYTEYVAQGVAPLSLSALMPDVDDSGGCDEEVAAEGWLDLERAYTHTLFFLAQAYGNCKQPDKSAEHVVLTLKRQMASKQYDPLDWAINASGISQFFLGQAEWRACMHCLVCASHVAKGAATDDRPEEEEEKHANIARCWLKYCIALLESGISEFATEPRETPLGKWISAGNGVVVGVLLRCSPLLPRHSHFSFHSGPMVCCM